MRLNIISATPQHSLSDLEVDEEATVATLQQRILDRLQLGGASSDDGSGGVTAQRPMVRLIHAGQLMRSEAPLSQYNLCDGATVHMVLRTRAHAHGDRNASGGHDNATPTNEHTSSSSSSSSSAHTTSFTFGGGGGAGDATVQHTVTMGVPVINVTAGDAAVTPDGGIDIASIMRMAAPMVQNIMNNMASGGGGAMAMGTSATATTPATATSAAPPTTTMPHSFSMPMPTQQQTQQQTAAASTPSPAAAAAAAAAAMPRPFVTPLYRTTAATTTTSAAAMPRAGEAAPTSPRIADIHVHVHCTVDELERLPEQLRRLAQRTNAAATTPPIVTHTSVVAPPPSQQQQTQQAPPAATQQQQQDAAAPPAAAPAAAATPMAMGAAFLVNMVASGQWPVLIPLRHLLRESWLASMLGAVDGDAAAHARAAVSLLRRELDAGEAGTLLQQRSRVPAAEARREAVQWAERALPQLMPALLDRDADDAAWAARVGPLLMRWLGVLARRASRWFADGPADLVDVGVAVVLPQLRAAAAAAQQHGGDVEGAVAQVRQYAAHAPQALREMAAAYERRWRRGDEDDVDAFAPPAPAERDDDLLEEVADELMRQPPSA